MKIRVFFSIAFLLASLVTSVQAEEQNRWYLGTKMGWSHFNPFIFLKNNVNNSEISLPETNIPNNDLSAPIFGLFLGYDFNSYLGLEIENNSNGFLPYVIFNKNQQYHQYNSLQLSTKLSYPITDDFHLFSRLGGTVFWDNLASKNDLKNMLSKESSVLPSVSLGAEYIFNKQFITRLDYTWKNSIKNITNLSFQPSLGDAVLSFGWKFGKSNNIFSTNSDDFLTQPHSMLNENINFPFNSTELKPVSYDKLNKLDSDIKEMKLKNISIVLLGHTDEIGNEEYNQKLSEDRAYSIKNYLTSHGLPRSKITVQGMSSHYPLTNQICKNIKNRSLLISCLAPDRRVEIEVLSID